MEVIDVAPVVSETNALQIESMQSRQSSSLEPQEMSHNQSFINDEDHENPDAIPLQPSESQKSISMTHTNTSTQSKHEMDFIDQVEKRKEQLKQELLDKSNVPSLYSKNSKKEDLVLAYVENFNRQYTNLYPGRKDLLLMPWNGYDVKKFICTTIRPTQLPFKELYDYRSCAAFVANYLTYEPLQPAHELPKVVPPPSYTLKLQYGNCFDFSILLVSLLRGVGYDAYVVSGYATKDITLMDRSKQKIFDYHHLIPSQIETSDFELQKATELSPESTLKYKVKPPRTLNSQFILKQEAKRTTFLNTLKKEKNSAAQEDSNAKIKDGNKDEEDEDDELKGLRVHSWVLILPGKREISEAFFIEPSTGEIYPTDHAYYLGVESVFSSQNYWVNMQVCFDGLKGISFDVGDVSKWEFVMLDNNKPGGIKTKYDDKRNEGSDDEDNVENPSEVLDLPPSWVEKFNVSRQQYESKCPSGSKSVTYRNVKCDTFAEYYRPDGMTLRISIFDGQDSGKINEYYENRKDKLRERVHLPQENLVHEYFNPGRLHGLKEHIIVNGKTREMHFYPNARSDGLYLRLEQENKIIERFVDREDLLSYRSVTFEPFQDSEPIGESGLTDHIIKMTEKFDYNSSNSRSDEPAKRTYFIKEEKMRIIHHLGPDRIIAPFREFKKPGQDAKTQSNSVDMVNIFDTNPFNKHPKKQHLYLQMLELIKAEQNCLQAVKQSEREVKDILIARQNEETDIALTISVYDTIRNNTKVPTENEADKHKEEEETKHTELDYISPFLINYDNPKNLSKEDAIAIKDACLKSLKERLIEKANIIQTRLDEITSEYQQRQVNYSKNADSMSIEETDEYVRFCNDALFKIHVLEKRLAKHKETAPEKYIDLDSKLRADPRLSIAFAS